MMSQAQSRFASKEPHDDTLLPFAIESLDLRGRIVRLGPTVNAILSHYDYPPPVARLLGEAVTLASLLGALLESHGRFQLQTRSDGVVDMMVVDYDAPGKLRAFARFDLQRLAQTDDKSPAAVLGRGHLALTIEREQDAARYQGVAPLEGESIAEAAHIYFRQSEQIPSYVRLAVGEVVTPQGRSWRAGGILLQYLPKGGAPVKDLAPGDAPAGVLIEDGDADAWTEGQALAATVEDHELIEPSLSSETLLYRLFHERGVKVYTERQLSEFCRCSQERIEKLLQSFSAQERRDMIGDNGSIGVTCEFCAIHRSFDPAAFV